jgi:hypothetical protein
MPNDRRFGENKINDWNGVAQAQGGDYNPWQTWQAM